MQLLVMTVVRKPSVLVQLLWMCLSLVALEPEALVKPNLNLIVVVSVNRCLSFGAKSKRQKVIRCQMRLRQPLGNRPSGQITHH